MFARGQCQTSVVGLAEEAEVLFYPLVVEEGSPVVGVCPGGAGADSGEDNEVRFGLWGREDQCHCQLPQP